jgi:ABC-2 type transport system ATP-binding protein
VIEFKNLKKTFGLIVAIDDLSLVINTGEVFGLLGPNGAGKTTTVNIAVGLLKPDTGSIAIGDFGSPLRREVRGKIGVATQALALYEELSAAENLEFFGRVQGIRGARLKRRVSEALEFVDLKERRRDRVKTFSGGMKRRLNLAVALIHEPPVIMLDEPTVGVDPQSRNAIFDNILHLRESGCTIIYTTHYMEEAERLCDRVGIMDHGKLLALGPVEELIASYGGKSILTAEREDKHFRIETSDPVSELAALQSEGKLIRFKVDSPDLESVFLSLTGRKLRD